MLRYVIEYEKNKPNLDEEKSTNSKFRLRFRMLYIKKKGIVLPKVQKKGKRTNIEYQNTVILPTWNNILDNYLLTLTKFPLEGTKSKTISSPSRRSFSEQKCFQPWPILILLFGTFLINREHFVTLPFGARSRRVENPDFHKKSSNSFGKFYKHK